MKKPPGPEGITPSSERENLQAKDNSLKVPLKYKKLPESRTIQKFNPADLPEEALNLNRQRATRNITSSNLANPFEFVNVLNESIIKNKIEEPPYQIIRPRTPIVQIPSDETDLKVKEIVEIGKMNDYERALIYEDDYPCFKYRKPLIIIKGRIVYFSQQVITQDLFEIFIIIIILANFVTMALDDPLNSTPETWQEVFEYTFQALYTIEMILKIFAKGFVLIPGSYLRDYWNIMDFIIVLSGYLSIFLSGMVNLSVFRTLRILRPLRTVSTFEGLKLLMNSLVASFSLLKDALIILMAFIFVMGIAGLQLFIGVARNMCVNVETGKFYDTTTVCGSTICPTGYTCAEYLYGGLYGTNGFDNIFQSMLMVYTSITMENWSNRMNDMMRGLYFLAFLYWIPIIFFGSFFLINLTLAVIKSKVTEVYAEMKEENKKKKEEAKLKRQKLSKKFLSLKSRRSGTKNQTEKIDGLTEIKEEGEQLPESEEREKMNSADPTLKLLHFKNICAEDQDRIDELIRESQEYEEKKKKEKEMRPSSRELLDPSKNNYLDQNESKEEEYNESENLNHKDLQIINSGIKPDSSAIIRDYQKVAGTNVHYGKEINIEDANLDSPIRMKGLIDMHPSPRETDPLLYPNLEEAHQEILSNKTTSRNQKNQDTTGNINQDRENQTRFKKGEDNGENSFADLVDFDENGSISIYESDMKHTDRPIKKINDKGKLVIQVKPKNENRKDPMAGKNLNSIGIPKRNDATNLEKDKDKTKNKNDPDKENKDDKNKKGKDEKEEEEEEEIEDKYKKVIIHRDILNLVNLFDVMTRREQEIEDDKKKEALLAAFQLEEAEKEPFTKVVKFQPTIKPKEDIDDDDDEDNNDRDESSNESNSSRSSSYKSSLNQSLTKGPTIRVTPIQEKKDSDNNSSHQGSSKKNQDDNSQRNDNISIRPNHNNQKSETKKLLNQGTIRPKDSPDKKGGSERSQKVEKSSESGSQSSKQGESMSQLSLNTEQSEGNFSLKYNKNTRVSIVIGYYKQLDELRYKKHCNWSGQDVIAYTPYDPERAVYICDMLSKIGIWEKGIAGYKSWLEKFIKRFFKHPFINTFLTLLVIANTIILCLDRYTQPELEDNICGYINNVFTYIFAVEVFCKLFAYGFRRYLSDPLNWFDIIVVIISLVEIVVSGGGASAISAMRAIRLLRTLRVLRVTRFIKSLQTMRMIVDVIGRSISSFAYIGFLLIIFICIFTLLGMVLLGDSYSDLPSSELPRHNFTTFQFGFITVFQVLTLGNWPWVLYDFERVFIPPITAIYCVVWCFLGNHILLNLFIAILLDAFLSEDQDTEKDDEENEGTSTNKSSITLGFSFSKSGQKSSKKTQSISFKSKSIKTPKTRSMKTIKAEQNVYMGNLDESEHQKLTIKRRKREEELYKKVDCEYSLYLFHKDTLFRKYIRKIQKHSAFETVIIIAIIINSLKLAVDSYYTDNATYSIFSDIFDTVFNYFFLAECIIKIISLGFFIDNGSYLSESWSKLDFVIVIVSMIDQWSPSVDLPFVKVLRMLRTLRPLRFISHNANMRIAIKALFSSFTAIVYVLIVLFAIGTMFGILGINFFSGKFMYCSIYPYVYSSQAQCEKARGTWSTFQDNFDHYLNAMLTIFNLYTTENWDNIMWQATDITDVRQGPLRDNAVYYAWYFVIFTFIGALFLMQLFIGVMFINFNEASKAEKNKFGGLMLTEEQIFWKDMVKLIIKATPQYEYQTKPPVDHWRKKFHDFITNKYVEIVVIICILINMLVMAMNFYNSNDTYQSVLDRINEVFTYVFIVEAIIKIIAFGVQFWTSPWNLFEFFIVVCSITDIVFTYATSNSSLKMLKVLPQISRILRVLRVTRLFRLGKAYQGIASMMEIISFSLPVLSNILLLLIIIMFIFAVLGTFLFSNITKGNVIGDDWNFKNFLNSFLLVWKCATGEDWNTVMYDCSEPNNCASGKTCYGYFMVLYFVILKFVLTFILMNLFILVTLQLFDEYFFKSENPLTNFNNAVDEFNEVWDSLLPTHSALMINENKLDQLFKRVTFFKMTDLDPFNLMGEIVSFKISSDEEGNVFYNEALFYGLRHVYLPQNMNKRMHEMELQAITHIRELADSASKTRIYETTREAFKKEEITKKGKVNPFYTYMFLKLTLDTWNLYSKERRERREKAQQEGRTNYDSSDNNSKNNMDQNILELNPDIPVSKINIADISEAPRTKRRFALPRSVTHQLSLTPREIQKLNFNNNPSEIQEEELESNHALKPNKDFNGLLQNILEEKGEKFERDNIEERKE